MVVAEAGTRSGGMRGGERGGSEPWRCATNTNAKFGESTWSQQVGKRAGVGSAHLRCIIQLGRPKREKVIVVAAGYAA